MNSFTALKNFSPFQFTSLFISFYFFFYLSYQPFSSLYFTIHNHNSLPFTFYFLSPSLPLTGFHFSKPRFENMGSPYCHFRQLVSVGNGPIRTIVRLSCRKLILSKFSGSLPPYIKDVCNNVKKSEICLKQFLHIHSFYSLEEHFQYKSITR